MAVTKAKKAEQIEKLNQDLQKASSMIVGTFSKLTVTKDFELRKTVRTAGGKYQVVKNTLAKRASEGTQLSEALKGLKGVSSIAYTSGDPVALAKALSKYVDDNPEFSFKSGVLEGRVIIGKRDQSAGHHAFQGRDLLQAAVPDERSGTAPGYGNERRRQRPGCGCEPGRGKEEVQGRRRRGSRGSPGGSHQLIAELEKFFLGDIVQPSDMGFIAVRSSRGASLGALEHVEGTRRTSTMY